MPEQPHPFSCTLERCGESSVLRLGGALDAVAAVALQRAIDPLLAAPRPRLVLHLAGLRYLGSAGVGVIVATLRRCRAAGGGLALAEPTEAVRELITTLNLDQIVGVHATAAQAAAILAGPTAPA